MNRKKERIKDYFLHHLSGAVSIYLIVLLIKLIGSMMELLITPLYYTELTNQLLYGFLVLAYLIFKFVGFVDICISSLVQYNIKMGKKCYQHIKESKMDFV